jgi:hypothetical protein
LKELTALRQLQELDLRWTKVTEAGQGMLKVALPHCALWKYASR